MTDPAPIDLSTDITLNNALAERTRNHRAEVEGRFATFAVGDAQHGEMVEIRNRARELALHIVDTTQMGYEQSEALKHLELAKYWANQSLARHGVVDRAGTEATA